MSQLSTKTTFLSNNILKLFTRDSKQSTVLFIGDDGRLIWPACSTESESSMKNAFHSICVESLEYFKNHSDYVIIMERACSDRSYRYSLCLTLCTSVESLLSRMTGLDSGKHGTVLFRTILHDETLKVFLSGGMIQFLHFLFLPNGLNYRNLIWHGFMSPEENKIEYFTLLLSLRCTLLGIIHSRNEVSSQENPTSGIWLYFVITL